MEAGLSRPSPRGMVNLTVWPDKNHQGGLPFDTRGFKKQGPGASAYVARITWELLAEYWQRFVGPVGPV